MISRHMHRRAFFHACLGAASAVPLAGRADAAGLPKTKITRIRYYKTPTDAAGRPNNRQPLFNQSTNVVLVETDSGLVGVGEGGAPDTMEQCAGLRRPIPHGPAMAVHVPRLLLSRRPRESACVGCARRGA